MKCKTGSLALLYIPLLAASPFSVRAQGKDSSMTAISLKNAMSVYHHQLNKSSGLYQGAEYENYHFRFEEGSPYFGGKDSVAGTILYDGVLYKDVFMKYDEVRDVMVIWYKNEAIQPANEKIGYFTMAGHTFVRITLDEHSKDAASTGFYERLYAGRTTAFKRVVKTIMDNPDMTDGILRNIEQKTYFYLLTAHGIRRIGGKGDLMDALTGHRSEIGKFIESNNLNLKKDPDLLLARVAAYYDTL
jgi:hypothetical protein